MLIAYTAPSKVLAAALKDLATEEDVTDILHFYHEYFDQSTELEEEAPISDALPNNQELNDCGGDFGMEEESKMTSVSLALALGYRTGVPPSFNIVRDRSGLTPWDDPKPFSSVNLDALPDNLTRLLLHWHQLAGNHSILRSVLSKVPEPFRTPGVLVADEVGLGKTAQAVAVISFFIQGIFLQQTKRKLPKIMREFLRRWSLLRADKNFITEERPFLGDKDKIPSQPHLIVCPGTLTAQWVSELKVFLQPKSVDIFVYDAQSSGETFWGPSGPVHMSKHLPHSRIIVTNHSVSLPSKSFLPRWAD